MKSPDWSRVLRQAAVGLWSLCLLGTAGCSRATAPPLEHDPEHVQSVREAVDNFANDL